MANTESIKWWATEKHLPDAEQTLLLHVPDASEPIWLGWFECQSPSGDVWRYVDGTIVIDTVTHWAELPAGPN